MANSRMIDILLRNHDLKNSIKAKFLSAPVMCRQQCACVRHQSVSGLCVSLSLSR